MAGRNGTLDDGQKTNNTNQASSSHNFSFLFTDGQIPLSSLIIVCLVALLGNSFLLVVVWKDPKRCLRTRSALLVTNLIVSDIIGAANIITRSIYRSLVNELRNGDDIRLLKRPLVISGYTALIVSLSTVFLISVEHFLAITQPLKFKILVTKKVIAFFIAATWTYGGFLAPALYIFIPGKNHVFQAITAHNVLLLVALPTIYTRAFYSLKNQLRAFDDVNGSSGNTDRKARRILQQKRFLFTSATLILVYIVTCAPFTIYNYMKISKNEFYNPYISHDLVGEVFWTILNLNMCVDPFLYCLRIPQYRKSCLAFLRINN